MVTFLLSTGIVFYAIVSVLLSVRMWGPVADYGLSKLDVISERSETLTYVFIIFGLPVLFVGLVIGWPVPLYLQIRKELADAD
ncbi:Uncharacterised protein [Mycobacteroides abscessus subsp. abscessus]|nr:Uncharacterised protein [Mycobacteroides abscessus subsp. abscessus]